MKHPDTLEAVRGFLAEIGLLDGEERAMVSLETYVRLLIQHASARDLLSASQRNSESVWSHVFDALQPLRLSSVRVCQRLIDAGSGGGLPGIPLAIVRPETSVFLVERSAAKAEFLELARALIPLRNAEVRCEQVQNVLRETKGEAHVLARALTQPGKWSALVKPGEGRFPWIIFATEKNRLEWEVAASRLGLAVKSSHEYRLPASASTRVLIEFANT